MNSFEFVSLDDVVGANPSSLDGILELSDEYLMLVHGGSSFSADSEPSSSAGFVQDVVVSLAADLLKQAIISTYNAYMNIQPGPPPMVADSSTGAEGGGSQDRGGGGAGGASGH